MRTLSDLAELAKNKPEEATFCIESEFSARDDGWPGLQEAYGIELPQRNVKLVDLGVVYTETKKGEPCNFGEVFTTDGRIAALNLQVLEDDKHFFPVYNPRSRCARRPRTSTRRCCSSWIRSRRSSPTR